MTHKKERFALEYAKTGNATASAKAAGYSEKTAYSAGHRLLKDVDIQNRIKEFKNNVADTIGVTAAMLANELKKVALSTVDDTRTDWMTLRDFKKLSTEAKAAIAEVQYVKKGRGKSEVSMVKLKYHSKIAAIELLCKMLGFNAPDKHEHAGAGGGPIKTEEVNKIDYSRLSNSALKEIIAASAQRK